MNNLILVTTTDSPKLNCRCVQFCVLNVRSIKNKTMTVKDFVVDRDIDILALTETWLHPGNIDDAEIRLEPYAQLALDSYMFQWVIPELEVLACYLKTLSKLIITSRIPLRHSN